MSVPKQGDLRVWHVPQFPGEIFYVPVASTDEALKIINLLANYDIFQYDHKIKPDYTNASGLEIYEGGGEWNEWESQEGDGIHDLAAEQDTL